MDATPTPQTETPRVPSLRKRLRLMAAMLVLLVLMGLNLAIGSGKLSFEKVTSESMVPTLLVNDVLLCDANAAIDRYAVVITDDPVEPGSKLVKRVIGLPGDQILIVDGVMKVRRAGEDDFREDSSPQVIGRPMVRSDGRWTVPAGHIFLMGDNRNFSLDSRDFGPVPLDTVHGVVSLIVWPPSRWQRLQPYQSQADDAPGSGD